MLPLRLSTLRPEPLGHCFAAQFIGSAIPSGEVRSADGTWQIATLARTELRNIWCDFTKPGWRLRDNGYRARVPF